MRAAEPAFAAPLAQAQRSAGRFLLAVNGVELTADDALALPREHGRETQR
jgi:hypothetical protein